MSGRITIVPLTRRPAQASRRRAPCRDRRSPRLSVCTAPCNAVKEAVIPSRRDATAGRRSAIEMETLARQQRPIQRNLTNQRRNVPVRGAICDATEQQVQRNDRFMENAPANTRYISRRTVLAFRRGEDRSSKRTKSVLRTPDRTIVGSPEQPSKIGPMSDAVVK